MDQCHNCFSKDMKILENLVEDGSKKWRYKCKSCKAEYELWEFIDD